MRKIHGAHCRLRSFPTKCKKCGASVLYWECTHGSKIFLDYPIIGKAYRHYCHPNLKKKKKEVLQDFYENRQKILNKQTYQCPICGKIFQAKSALDNHLKKKSKNCELHEEFCRFFYQDLLTNNFEIDEDINNKLKEESMYPTRILDASNYLETDHRIFYNNDNVIIKKRGQKSNQ